jgi:hypothetical protein
MTIFSYSIAKNLITISDMLVDESSTVDIIKQFRDTIIKNSLGWLEFEFYFV